MRIKEASSCKMGILCTHVGVLCTSFSVLSANLLQPRHLPCRPSSSSSSRWCMLLTCMSRAENRNLEVQLVQHTVSLHCYTIFQHNGNAWRMPDKEKEVQCSALWKHFEESTTAGSARLVTAFANHLRWHVLVFKEYQNDCQQLKDNMQHKITDMMKRQNTISSWRKGAADAKVARMIAVNLQPFSVVNSCGFRELMTEGIPGYTPLSKRLFHGWSYLSYMTTREGRHKRNFACLWKWYGRYTTDIRHADFMS